MRLVYGLFDEPQDAHMVYPISAHAMDHQRDADGGFVIEATTIQDPISFATTLEDEGGPLWGQPLVDAVRKFRHWVGVLAMVNDENNGTVTVDEGGGESFAADFNDREHARMDAALGFSRDVLRAAGATRVCWTGLASTHVQGTCRMGSDPERSVVDADGRVWGVDRLYVGDGSIVPRTLSVNPSLTIMALASRLAEHLHDDPHAIPRVSDSVVVVSAHSADFVWRAAGAIALAAEAGADVHVIALSYGERGESGELWKEEGQTEERVKEIRHGEAEAAADALGASFRSLDLGDYPLVLDAPAVERLTDQLRELAPRLVLTHAALDPFNPDHGVAHDATVRARQLASGAGVASGFVTITPPELLSFEPHQPELCGFVPTTFLDITPVWEKKVAAMETMGAQSYLRQYYSERAEHRANHARRISGRSEIRYAEAFQRELPVVVDAL